METRRCYGCMAPASDAAYCPRCGYPADKENEPHQLRPGTVLQEKYLLGKVLGQGGFGITYLGWDLEREETIAVKEYYPATLVTRDTSHSDRIHCYSGSVSQAYLASKGRFLREAQALARLEDVPSVVRILDRFELNDTAYIVMEYVKGSSLYSYISMRGGRLDFGETMNILRPVMDALTAVHAMGLIHRDLSPDNIMLHPTRGAVLLDFGAVRDVTGADADKPLLKSTEAILKHGFAPVEQYRTRGSLGPWTDIYALCATVYYCLTGRVPPEAVARLMGEEQLDWDAVPGLTDRQRKVLDKGMAINAPQRYMSIPELLQDLTEASLPIGEKTDTASGDGPGPSKLKRIAVFLGIGAVLISLGLCIRLLFAPKAGTEQEAPQMSDSAYDDPSLPEKPHLRPPTEEPTEPSDTPTEPSETTEPPSEEELPEGDDITAPEAYGAKEMNGIQSVYYSTTHQISTAGVDCTWNLDPITIAFSEQLGFTEDSVRFEVCDASGQKRSDLGIQTTWDGSTVYVDLPNTLPHGVYHIKVLQGTESLDYVICSGENGKYYPISQEYRFCDAGLKHQDSGLLLVRGEEGFSMTRNEQDKTRFTDSNDICCVEYRNGNPYPTVSGEPARLECIEYFQFDRGHMYLLKLDGWYLAYRADLGLYFTMDLDWNCHWSISW